MLTKGLIDVTFNTGSDHLRVGNGVNNGAQHGTSATPTTLSYATGRFGPGRLNACSFTTTQRAGRRGLVSLELDDNAQKLDDGKRFQQWLERFSYTYQAGPDSSFAVGVRRIIGSPPYIGVTPIFQRGWNLSAAYHRIFSGANEVYLVYGDAGAFATVPQLILKWIHYFGGEKGI